MTTLRVNAKVETPEQLLELCATAESVTIATDDGVFLARAFRDEESEATIQPVGSGVAEQRLIRDGIAWCGANPTVRGVWGMYPCYRDMTKADAESARVGEEATRFYELDD